jgi:hypothetical protein
MTMSLLSRENPAFVVASVMVVQPEPWRSARAPMCGRLGAAAGSTHIRKDTVSHSHCTKWWPKRKEKSWLIMPFLSSITLFVITRFIKVGAIKGIAMYIRAETELLVRLLLCFLGLQCSTSSTKTT